jgi:rod shape-determining protein MreD
MCLRVVPLSEGMALLNPDWVLLVLIYWALNLPERCEDLRYLVKAEE